MERRVFPKRKDEIGRNGGRPYDDLRWSRFKDFSPADMYNVVGEHVFPFLRTLGGERSHQLASYAVRAHHRKPSLRCQLESRVSPKAALQPRIVSGSSWRSTFTAADSISNREAEKILSAQPSIDAL